MISTMRKNRMYKVIITMVLMCIISVIMGKPSYAAENAGSCGTFMEWSLSGDVLTISGSGDMADYSDSEFAPWYPYAESIKTVELSSGMLSIGDFAFYGCINLKNIVIPDKVTDIGVYAFAKCTELTYVDWGDSVQKIGEGAFQGCESLKTISIPESLTDIGDKAFYRCYGLKTVFVPCTVKNMGELVFTYCTSLVRATINASISQIPGWTFYGCTSLTDVSLGAGISSASDYAFSGCSSLNGIYTQEGNPDTAYQIEQSIEKSEGERPQGFVGTFDMPDSSIVTINDEDRLTKVEVIQADDMVISVEDVTDYTDEKSEQNTVISASVENKEDWNKLLDNTLDIIENRIPGSVTIEVNFHGNTVDSEDLILFAGKDVIVKIVMDNGIVWKIYMSDMSEESFSGKYDLRVQLLSKDSEEIGIVGEKVYLLKFADHIDFNATLGMKDGSTYDLVSFYQKEEGTYQIINTVIVDQYGWAWFALGHIDKKTDYCMAFNVEGVKRNDAVIPDTMLQYYDLDVQNESSYLMDEDGVKYQITGRSSKWGISGKQFAIYISVAMLAAVLVVGIIMTTLNIIKRSREKYDLMARENELKKILDEENLRVEIIKELLNEESKNNR